MQLNEHAWHLLNTELELEIYKLTRYLDGHCSCNTGKYTTGETDQ